jgi:hypothetical protein
VATSGSARRKPAYLTAVLLLVPLLGVALLAACSRPSTAPKRTSTDSATPVARSVTTPGPSAGGLAAFCASRPDAAIAAQLASLVPGSTRHEVIPLGVSSDGRTGYVSAWTPAFSGVAAIDLRTGALRPIMSFADPAVDQADGAWGGRFLVWEETYSLQSLDRFTVYAWSAAAGRLLVLGRSLAEPNGIPWPSPWHAPAVSGNYAAWTQGYGPGGLVQVRLADLATGRVTVVAAGHLQAPFFDGDLLVWPASGRPGALTRLHAYSLATHRMAPLPLPLRAVAGTDFVVSDGTRTAYLNAALTRLYYSPSARRPARLMLALPPGEEFSGLGLAAGALAWTTTTASYVADLATGSYLQVTPAYGLAVTSGGPAVLVSDAPAGKAAHPALALHVIDPRSWGPGLRPAPAGHQLPGCGLRS